jgi:hypothetical protein
MNKKEYYEIEEFLKSNNSNNLPFKLKLFIRMNNIYFKRTPESDSLYRRRNRLVVLFLSLGFYFKTANGVFSNIELKLLTSGSFMKKMVRILLIFTLKAYTNI